jgi:hypothetical protein
LIEVKMSWEMGIPNFYFLAPPLLGGLHYIFFRVASRCIAFASCRPHSSPHKPTRCRPVCLLSSGLRLLAWWVSDDCVLGDGWRQPPQLPPATLHRHVPEPTLRKMLLCTSVTDMWAPP